MGFSTVKHHLFSSLNLPIFLGLSQIPFHSYVKKYWTLITCINFALESH